MLRGRLIELDHCNILAEWGGERSALRSGECAKVNQAGRALVHGEVRLVGLWVEFGTRLRYVQLAPLGKGDGMK